jgi:hypothetical protein
MGQCGMSRALRRGSAQRDQEYEPENRSSVDNAPWRSGCGRDRGGCRGANGPAAIRRDHSLADPCRTRATIPVPWSRAITPTSGPGSHSNPQTSLAFSTGWGRLGGSAEAGLSISSSGVKLVATTISTSQYCGAISARSSATWEAGTYGTPHPSTRSNRGTEGVSSHRSTGFGRAGPTRPMLPGRASFSSTNTQTRTGSSVETRP